MQSLHPSFLLPSLDGQVRAAFSHFFDAVS